MSNNGMHPEKLEQMFRTIEARKRFRLGLPKVHSTICPRLLLTPEGVSMLASQGIEVRIESELGAAVQYPDERYRRAGATIVSRSETWKADVVIYAGLPEPEEAALLKPHSLLLTLTANRTLHVETARLLLQRNVTVISLDLVSDRRHRHPVSDILGEVSGRAAITVATAFMAGSNGGKGILLGGVAGVNPCEVVILGTGMAALAAARSAIGLGGMVRLFDSDPYCLRTAIAELGAAVIGSALHPGVLGHALASADVVIATGLHGPFTIDNSVLDSMKKGVIILDLNDRFGISSVFPTMTCIDVAYETAPDIRPGNDICFINPGGTVGRTAAMAMTNEIIPLVDRLLGTGRGVLNVLKTDEGLRNAITFFGGRIVNREIAERLGARSVDINLLLSFS